MWDTGHGLVEEFPVDMTIPYPCNYKLVLIGLLKCTVQCCFMLLYIFPMTDIYISVAGKFIHLYLLKKILMLHVSDFSAGNL